METRRWCDTVSSRCGGAHAASFDANQTNLPGSLPPRHIKQCPPTSAASRHRAEQYTSSHGEPPLHLQIPPARSSSPSFSFLFSSSSSSSASCAASASASFVAGGRSGRREEGARATALRRDDAASAAGGLPGSWRASPHLRLFLVLVASVAVQREKPSSMASWVAGVPTKRWQDAHTSTCSLLASVWCTRSGAAPPTTIPFCSGSLVVTCARAWKGHTTIGDGWHGVASSHFNGHSFTNNTTIRRTAVKTLVLSDTLNFSGMVYDMF